ncbi:MAG: oxidoreductase, partial [Bacteroidota bacterium]|nr:oxidoreductase [Bacteroidota bacterium]
DKDGKIIRAYLTPPQGNYMDYFDQLYKAIRFNEALPVTAQQGLDVIKMIEAAIESNKAEKVIAC